jgi:DNA mismatch repair protein MutS
MSKQLTPLMQQYFEIREQFPDTMLMFQVGDFYELFFEDAEKAAASLGIALTKRGTHDGEPIPLAGVPLHAKDLYVTKLIKAGYKVALCDQLETPKPGKLVKRGVTQVLTPGTLTDAKLLDEKSASYLAVCYPTTSISAFLCAELLTGQLFVTLVSDTVALDAELNRFMPDEIVLPSAKKGSTIASFFQKQGYVVSFEQEGEADPFAKSEAEKWFVGQFGEHPLLSAESVKGAIFLLHSYLHRSHEQGLRELRQLSVYKAEDYLLLDAATQRNLELVKNSQDGSSRHTLFSLLDKAVTPMGSRMLKKWLLRPLINKEHIEERLDAVETIMKDHEYKSLLRKKLQQVGDAERIIGRISLRRAQLYDYTALLTALGVVPDLQSLLSKKQTKLLGTLRSMIADFSPLRAVLSEALNDDPNNAWLIKPGYHKELDRLRILVASGAQALHELEKREQEKTGISSLKIRHNQVHGYAIEITKPNLHLVPERYSHHQKLANRERFVTKELQELEHALKRAQADIDLVEQQVYESVKQLVEGYIPALKKLAYSLAYTDSLGALAEVAYGNRYTRPTFNESQQILIKEGRHPVVEARLVESFIPNTVDLNNAASLWLITGPNMGGKSTFLRQVALITLMAQIGSFVPAAQAHISIVDRIFTRIGASDNVAEGKSTFLVEMEETALICSEATSKSLVILDEVGRGTSTFDGLAIAQAVVEYIYNTRKSRCLFATHNHELPALCRDNPGIKPFYAASTKVDDAIVLLHKILPGVADGSFGLEVAALAKLPQEIIARARTIIKQLKLQEAEQESVSLQAISGVSQNSQEALQARIQELEAYIAQIDKAHKKDTLIAAQIAQLDSDNLTPRQALDFIWKLKEAS